MSGLPQEYISGAQNARRFQRDLIANQSGQETEPESIKQPITCHNRYNHQRHPNKPPYAGFHLHRLRHTVGGLISRPATLPPIFHRPGDETPNSSIPTHWRKRAGLGRGNSRGHQFIGDIFRFDQPHSVFIAQQLDRLDFTASAYGGQNLRLQFEPGSRC
jgi:hypothetical protein